ncbi:hypothetical protein ACWGLE_22055 [Streptomyces sp. NPDC055897]
MSALAGIMQEYVPPALAVFAASALSVRQRREKRVHFEGLFRSAKERFKSTRDRLELGRIARDLETVRYEWRPLREQADELLNSRKFTEAGGAAVLAKLARDHDAAIRIIPVTLVRGEAPAPPTPKRTLHLATTIAGRRRVHLREEWAAVLAGDPGNGLILTPRQRLRLVVGFLFAAVRFRIHDALGLLWAPVDWILAEGSRSETITALTVGAQVIYIAWNDGMHALLTEGWGWCAGCGGALYLLTRWLRRVRGIELAAVRSSGDE